MNLFGSDSKKKKNINFCLLSSVCKKMFSAFLQHLHPPVKLHVSSASNFTIFWNWRHSFLKRTPHTVCGSISNFIMNTLQILTPWLLCFQSFSLYSNLRAVRCSTCMVLIQITGISFSLLILFSYVPHEQVSFLYINVLEKKNINVDVLFIKKYVLEFSTLLFVCFLWYNC